VIITIMVLELKPPHGTDAKALQAVVPTFAAYVLSFVFVGIDGRSMSANLHLRQPS
jgi:uncharacterized membrane protein